MARKPLSDAERAQGRSLGEVFLQRREHDRIERRTLARQADISEETLRNIEAGKSAAVTFLVVARIASSLGISLNDLGNAIEKEEDK